HKSAPIKDTKFTGPHVKPTETKTETHSETVVEEVIEVTTVTGKDGHLDSELIVSGAAYQALRKFKCQRNKVKTTIAYDKTDAVGKVSAYAKAEVDKLVAKNETHNKEDVSSRAVRVARFLLENYYDDVNDCKCFEE